LSTLFAKATFDGGLVHNFDCLLGTPITIYPNINITQCIT